MTRWRPLLACLSLCVMLPAGRAQGDDSDRRVTSDEIALLRDDVARLERRALPPVLLDRQGIEAVFGTDLSEYKSRFGRERYVTRYRLRVEAALDVWYVDGYAADVRLHTLGSAGGRPIPVPAEVYAELRHRRDTVLALLDAYHDELPPGGIILSDRICQELLAHLADRPASRLCGAIVRHLPADQDAALLPVLIAFRGTDQDEGISRRIRALAHRHPELVGVLVTAMADDAVDDVRKETVTDALRMASGYGPRASPWLAALPHRPDRTPEDEVRSVRAKWWREWWTRHRERAPVDWIVEPLAIETYRESACVALGNLDDPRALPILVRLLDDDVKATRLYAASALLRRKYERRRYEHVSYAKLERDEVAVMAEAREWARSQGIRSDEAAEHGAPTEADESRR